MLLNELISDQEAEDRKRLLKRRGLHLGRSLITGIPYALGSAAGAFIDGFKGRPLKTIKNIIPDYDFNQEIDVISGGDASKVNRIIQDELRKEFRGYNQTNKIAIGNFMRRVILSGRKGTKENITSIRNFMDNIPGKPFRGMNLSQKTAMAEYFFALYNAAKTSREAKPTIKGQDKSKVPTQIVTPIQKQTQVQAPTPVAKPKIKVNMGVINDVKSALENLGYKPKDVTNMIRNELARNPTSGTNFDSLLRGIFKKR